MMDDRTSERHHMISTLLAADFPHTRSVFLVAAVLAVAVAAVLAASGRGGRVTAGLLSVVGVGAVLALTLSPIGSSVGRSSSCNVEPYNFFSDTANVALFFVPAIFLVIATRSAAVVAVLGPIGSASIEIAQYALPELSRRCDIDDLLANSAGAIAAALIGAVILLGVRLVERHSAGREHSSTPGPAARIPEYR